MTKKLKQLKNFILGMLLMVGIGSFAQEFPVTVLPCTLNDENDIAAVDIDGNGISDFIFIYDILGGDNACAVLAYNSIFAAPSGELSLPSITSNSILSESVELYPQPINPGQYLNSSVVFPFSRIMPQGDLVGDGLLYGADAEWGPVALLFMSGLFPFGGNSLEANSYEDGVLSGYLGVYFRINDHMHYGWINVKIDSDGEWVKINSTGYEPLIDAPIPAGLNDPYVVPVPFIASLLGFSLIGAGVFWRSRKRKK